MKLLKKVYVYVLVDARGEAHVAVNNDPADDITIGGHDAQGVYQQFDSYEAYHLHGWAEDHGFTIHSDVQTLMVVVAPEAK